MHAARRGPRSRDRSFPGRPGRLRAAAAWSARREEVLLQLRRQHGLPGRALGDRRGGARRGRRVGAGGGGPGGGGGAGRPRGRGGPRATLRDAPDAGRPGTRRRARRLLLHLPPLVGPAAPARASTRRADLGWFPLDALPDPVVPHERVVLEGCAPGGAAGPHVRLPVRIPEPRRLRALLTALATQWALELGEPWELSFRALVPVRTRDGADAVLKVVPPAAEYLERSAVALTGWAGAGAVRLLRADLPRGALLLERALPGRPRRPWSRTTTRGHGRRDRRAAPLARGAVPRAGLPALPSGSRLRRTTSAIPTGAARAPAAGGAGPAPWRASCWPTRRPPSSCTATSTTTTSCARATAGWRSTRTALSATPAYDAGRGCTTRAGMPADRRGWRSSRPRRAAADGLGRRRPRRRVGVRQGGALRRVDGDVRPAPRDPRSRWPRCSSPGSHERPGRPPACPPRARRHRLGAGRGRGRRAAVRVVGPAAPCSCGSRWGAVILAAVSPDRGGRPRGQLGWPWPSGRCWPP